MAKARASAWDLTALLNAADPKAALAERHLWVIRLMEWLRHAPLESSAGAVGDPRSSPAPALRLKHILGVLERNDEHLQRAGRMLVLFLREVDSAALLADFGFAPRNGLWAEFGRRVRGHILPTTPATTDLGELFGLLFPPGADAGWLTHLDDETQARLQRVLAPLADDGSDWRTPFLDAIMFLASSVRAAGFSPALRSRMSPELLADQPFRQLARAAEKVSEHAEASHEPGPEADAAHAAMLQDAQYLRALLDLCRRCADSVHEHLEAHGVSVDVVFEADQLKERAHRIDALLTCVLSDAPATELLALVAALAHTAEERRSIRALFSQHYSLLARKVAERSAATGEHYITRDRAEYAHMLRAALGGGGVLGLTTLAKFGIAALGLGAFWGGLGAGLSYTASFLLVQVLHFTVATKQPAMTAPALADKLGDVASHEGVERFVDEVAHLIRSQAAGIFGNVLAVIPVVLAAQWIARAAFGAPLVSTKEADHVLGSLTLLGPTALFAAFTGVLLFASSVIAGWVENWFVWHRLDSAIAWNPRIVARLGAARARRWSAWWRANISGFASNLSLGLLLGLVPAVAAFFSLPLDVRHVTLSTGQLFVAVGAKGLAIVGTAPFWWCVAGIAAIGTLNVGVSFFLAFRVALRSRGIRLADRSRIHRAIRWRMRIAPMSFLLPPRTPAP